MKKIWQFLLHLWRVETTGRKWCVFTVAVSLSIIAGAALLVFTVDPSYRYRAPVFYDMVYYEIYATAPHILKKQPYDLLMLGTSMTRNFFLEDIDASFGCQSVKLAASGGTMKDLCTFFRVAREAKGDQLKQVILSLDIYPLNKDYSHCQDFDYLYRDDHREDYRYLFSRQSFSHMYFLLKRKMRPKRNVNYRIASHLKQLNHRRERPILCLYGQNRQSFSSFIKRCTGNIRVAVYALNIFQRRIVDVDGIMCFRGS